MCRMATTAGIYYVLSDYCRLVSTHLCRCVHDSARAFSHLCFHTFLAVSYKCAQITPEQSHFLHWKSSWSPWLTSAATLSGFIFLWGICWLEEKGRVNLRSASRGIWPQSSKVTTKKLPRTVYALRCNIIITGQIGEKPWTETELELNCDSINHVKLRFLNAAWISWRLTFLFPNKAVKKSTFKLWRYSKSRLQKHISKEYRDFRGCILQFKPSSLFMRGECAHQSLRNALKRKCAPHYLSCFTVIIPLPKMQLNSKTHNKAELRDY